MTTVYVRLPEELARQIDKWIAEGKFLVSMYYEKERARKLFQLLEKRNTKAKQGPERLIPLKEIY